VLAFFFRCVMLSNRITFICHGEAGGKSGTSGKNTLVVRGAIGLFENNSSFCVICFFLCCPNCEMAQAEELVLLGLP
jgi:hypothetical protein